MRPATPLKQALDIVSSLSEDLWTSKESDGPPNLFHYTSVGSAFPILKSQILWASDVLCLNDASELAYGSRVMSAVVKGHTAVPDHVRDELCNLDAPAAESGLMCGFPYDPSAGVQVCCFCGDKGDSLGQWRAYGAGGNGIALGFDRRALSDSVEHAELVRVLYDRDEQDALMGRYIDIVADTAKTLVDVDSDQFWISAMVSMVVMRFPLRYKDPAFSSEDEWRLVRRYPKETMFRATSRMVIPYGEMAFPKNAIRELMLGPTVAPAGVVERSLSMFLINAGYEIKRWNLRSSMIPLRSL